MGGRVTSPTVIGRDAELASIAQAVASAKAGQPRIMLIAGDAGIGKTRLITEACTRAEQDGVLTAVGGCVQLGQSSLAYAPLIEALRGVRRRLGDEDFTELLGPAVTTVGVMLGLSEGSGVDPGRLIEQLLGLLGRLAARQPMLLVFEDMHWADASTRDLVAFLARNLRHIELSLVLTYRGDELPSDHPWRQVLADLQRDSQVERITLSGLGRSDLRSLLEQLSDAPIAVDDVLYRTDGNPLYVEELIAASDLGGPVPPTLAELILARVARLPQPTPAVLHQAAVLGELVDDEWLAELTGRPLSTVIDALRSAVDHRLLIVDRNGLRFRHALVRDALYEDLLPRERERLHSSAVRLIRSHQRSTPEHIRQTLLAYHAYAAGDFETALIASVHAGMESERVFALSAAAVQYERALSLWDRVADPDAAAGISLSDLYTRAAHTLFFGSRSDRTVALMEAALTALPSEVGAGPRVELLDQIAQLYGLLERGHARLDACQRALALVADPQPSPEKALALSMLGQTLMLHSQFRRAEPLLRQAIAIADQVDARAVTGRAQCYLANVLTGFGRADEAVTAHRQALQLCRDYGTDVHVCVSYLNMSYDLVLCSHYDQADQVASEGVRHAIDTGHANFYAAAISGNRIGALYCAGRWTEAAHVIAQFADRVPEINTWLHGSWLHVLLGQGRLREAREILDMLLTQTAGSADMHGTAEVLLCAGQLADLEQRWGDAREFFRRTLDLARASDDQDVISRGYASAICAERRRIEFAAGRQVATEEVHLARQIADELIHEAGELPVRLSINGIQLLPAPAAWLQTAEAEHAAIHGQDTAQTWADLAETWQAVGQPYSTAVATYRHADALLRERGDRDQARRLAADALEIAENLGAAPLATEIRQLAERGRLGLTRPAPQPQPETETNGMGITAREAEVLSLLAAGRTNREIARALFISDKTASVHVSNLLRKLGAANRAEAAAIAQRHGLTDTNVSGTNTKPRAAT